LPSASCSRFEKTALSNRRTHRQQVAATTLRAHVRLQMVRKAELGVRAVVTRLAQHEHPLLEGVYPPMVVRQTDIESDLQPRKRLPVFSGADRRVPDVRVEEVGRRHK